jgi:hypothetical protein
MNFPRTLGRFSVSAVLEIEPGDKDVTLARSRRAGAQQQQGQIVRSQDRSSMDWGFKVLVSAR